MKILFLENKKLSTITDTLHTCERGALRSTSPTTGFVCQNPSKLKSILEATGTSIISPSIFGSS